MQQKVLVYVQKMKDESTPDVLRHERLFVEHNRDMHGPLYLLETLSVDNKLAHGPGHHAQVELDKNKNKR